MNRPRLVDIFSRAQISPYGSLEENESEAFARTLCTPCCRHVAPWGAPGEELPRDGLGRGQVKEPGLVPELLDVCDLCNSELPVRQLSRWLVPRARWVSAHLMNWVEAPDSEAIARDLNESGAKLCPHAKNPCALHCGVHAVKSERSLRWGDDDIRWIKPACLDRVPWTDSPKEARRKLLRGEESRGFELRSGRGMTLSWGIGIYDGFYLYAFGYQASATFEVKVRATHSTETPGHYSVQTATLVIPKGEGEFPLSRATHIWSPTVIPTGDDACLFVGGGGYPSGLKVTFQNEEDQDQTLILEPRGAAWTRKTWTPFPIEERRRVLAELTHYRPTRRELATYLKQRPACQP